MAYTVNKTNSSASPNQYIVQDGVVNTQTDLSLIGKGYAGYGELIGENFLHLLENFAGPSAPPINSTIISTSLFFKIKLKLFTHWLFLNLIFLFLFLFFAETKTILKLALFLLDMLTNC